MHVSTAHTSWLWRHCGHSHAALPSTPWWTPPLKCEPGYAHFPLIRFCQSILLHQHKKKLSLPPKLPLSILTKLTAPPRCPTEVCPSLADPGGVTYFYSFSSMAPIYKVFCLFACLPSPCCLLSSLVSSSSMSELNPTNNNQITGSLISGLPWLVWGTLQHFIGELLNYLTS